MIKCSYLAHHCARDPHQPTYGHGTWHSQRLRHQKESMYILFCFRKDHLSSNRGFSVGEDDDHTLYDLPSRYAPMLGTWSQHIHQAISSGKVFPVNTCDEQTRIIKSHSGGHGYEALLAIIQLEHPIYHPHPTTGIRNPPRQGKNEALSGYFYRYLDYLQP